MLRELFLDLETKKLFSEAGSNNPADLGVSIVSIYLRKTQNPNSGSFYSFWEKDFDKLWPFLQSADRIIGFNTLHFDIPALQPYCVNDLFELKHFDILHIIKTKLGRRLSLDALARETLGSSKSGTGIGAVDYWRLGDAKSLKKLRSYCEKDVAVTRDLYDFIVRNGYVKYKDKWNQIRQIELDFSYHQNKELSSQPSLF